jgi:hypothetical protein
VLDQLGPPNVLLVNRGGGRFEIAPENSTVGLWRNSLQATWCDYNQDGRPDLYIANDWGPAVLFRNDGPAGFKDVTSELGLTSYGFSMGASGATSIMTAETTSTSRTFYSDAGSRIMPVSGVEQDVRLAGSGNFHHREADGRLSRSPVWSRQNDDERWLVLGRNFTDFTMMGSSISTFLVVIIPHRRAFPD